MEKNIELLNEILEQIDNISKENLDKAIKMSEENAEKENKLEAFVIKDENYNYSNNGYRKQEKYEIFNLHIKSTSNIEEVA